MNKKKIVILTNGDMKWDLCQIIGRGHILDDSSCLREVKSEDYALRLVLKVNGFDWIE